MLLIRLRHQMCHSLRKAPVIWWNSIAWKNLVCDAFDVRYEEILPQTYDCDDLVYATLFKTMNYYYSAVVTSDYEDYTIDVTCKIPDIRGCVEEILADETFMNDVCRPWFLALIGGGDTSDLADPDKEYSMMKEKILLEALDRITSGEYTEKIIRTDYFSLHKNGLEDWLCTGFPDIIYICGKDNFLFKLTYIDMISEYYLLEQCGTDMVSKGELEQERLDAFLDQKRQEITDAQQG